MIIQSIVMGAIVVGIVLVMGNDYGTPNRSRGITIFYCAAFIAAAVLFVACPLNDIGKRERIPNGEAEIVSIEGSFITVTDKDITVYTKNGDYIIPKSYDKTHVIIVKGEENKVVVNYQEIGLFIDLFLWTGNDHHMNATIYLQNP